MFACRAGGGQGGLAYFENQYSEESKSHEALTTLANYLVAARQTKRVDSKLAANGAAKLGWNLIGRQRALGILAKQCDFRMVLRT